MTPAAVRTGNLEGAYIQVWVDLLLQSNPAFPTTPQDMLDAGANEFTSVIEHDFHLAMAGYLILARTAVDPGFDCLDALEGVSGGLNLSYARSIDAVIAAILVGDPGYDGSWQTLAPLANDFASVPHRVRRGCILYCLSQYLFTVDGGVGATLTEAIAAGCCCGTLPPIWSVAVLSETGGGLPPPSVDDGILKDSGGDPITDFLNDTFQANSVGGVPVGGGTGFTGDWATGDNASQLVAYDRIRQYTDTDPVQGLDEGEGWADDWQAYSTP